MNYIEHLQNKLSSETDHSNFLERLLEALYGEGWDKLTIAQAERCDIIRPHNKPVEPTASSAEDQAEYWADKDPRNDGETI